MATIESEFLSFSISKLEELTNRIEICISKLTPEQVWTRGGEQQNAAGNLLLHLNGNVRQWIVSGLCGAADRRQRDLEFSERAVLPPAELVSRLRETVTEAVAVLRTLSADQLIEPVRIQGYEGTKLTAIYHVIEHFAGHAFQIFLLTKFLTDEDLGFYAHLSGAKAAPAATP
ncbi:MAG TPA: DUF1572 family protein [Bryobacteraceae bacterium]